MLGPVLVVGDLLLSEYLMPVLVTLTTTVMTAYAMIAWKLYQLIASHDRALFGDERNERHDGVVSAVNDNTERSERNRRALAVNDMIPAGRTGGPATDDSEDGTAAAHRPR